MICVNFLDNWPKQEEGSSGEVRMGPGASLAEQTFAETNASALSSLLNQLNLARSSASSGNAAATTLSRENTDFAMSEQAFKQLLEQMQKQQPVEQQQPGAPLRLWCSQRATLRRSRSRARLKLSSTSVRCDRGTSACWALVIRGQSRANCSPRFFRVCG